jgi:integrase/recombinase XerD
MRFGPFYHGSHAVAASGAARLRFASGRQQPGVLDRFAAVSRRSRISSIVTTFVGRRDPAPSATCRIGDAARSRAPAVAVDVGEAVADYILGGRPPEKQGRLFVSAGDPARCSSAKRVRTLLCEACRRAGIPAITAHVLRHTAATEMLRAGATLIEVGQVLRHRSVSTTTIYAKVDRERLRALARPWPEREA